MNIIKTTACLLLLVSSLAVAACQNTIKGAGEDMQKNGQHVENSVQ